MLKVVYKDYRKTYKENTKSDLYSKFYL